MKRPLFLILLTVGVVGLAVATAYWWQKSTAWNTTAITARYVEATVYVSNAGTSDSPASTQSGLLLEGDSLRYSTNFVYDLTNTSSRDYRLPAPSDSMVAMTSQGGSLVTAHGLAWYQMPASTFLAPQPFTIPSHKTVRVLFALEAVYLRGIVNNRTPQKFVADTLADVDSFVLMDYARRYRIELSLAEFKAAKPPATSSAEQLR